MQDVTTRLDAPTERTDARYFRLLLIGRVATCLSILLLLVGIDLFVSGSGRVAAPIALLVALVALTLPYRLLERARPARVRALSLAVIAIDTILLAAGLYLVGGQNAIFGLPLYGILIVMAAVVHSTVASYAIAALGAVSFAAMISSVSAGVLPAREGVLDPSADDAYAAAAIITTVFLSGAMAVVASSLSRVKDGALAQSREYEEKLEQLNESLEERIRNATADLERKADAVERALENIELFSRAVAHDLRNPLTAALELQKLGRKASDPDERARLMDMAAENLLRADRMLIGLRDLMRTSSVPGTTAALEVQPVLAALLVEFEQVEGRVKFELRDGLGTVAIAREQLEHVFRNLISNALDHNTDRPSLTIEIGRLGSDDPADPFYVKDDGRGISPGVVTRIFEPFRRGPLASEDGLGLGLALVDGIVKRAGGRVWCESTEGAGATFWFTLPS